MFAVIQAMLAANLPRLRRHGLRPKCHQWANSILRVPVKRTRSEEVVQDNKPRCKLEHLPPHWILQPEARVAGLAQYRWETQISEQSSIIPDLHSQKHLLFRQPLFLNYRSHFLPCRLCRQRKKSLGFLTAPRNILATKLPTLNS